jgi:ubiquinone/menaquinone biosynthesis C-methylase UbiE
VDYEAETQDAYRNEVKAKAYHEQYIRGAKWARFTMWRQRRLVDTMLSECRLGPASRILDIPCGTGVVGRSVCRTGATVIAADISTEMMARARDEYSSDAFKGFVQCDITNAPFRNGSFDCLVLLAFMHRLPTEVRQKTWDTVVRLSKRFVIINYSVDSPSQRWKQWLLKTLRPNYRPAPSPLGINDIQREIESFGMVIVKMRHIARFFSGKILFVLERSASLEVEPQPE